MKGVFEFIGSIVIPVAIVQMILVSIIAIRLLSYWSSFIFGWHRYRERSHYSDQEIIESEPPHLKVQITTRGSEGSTEVILRGINGVLRLVQQSPELASFFSIEVVTESVEQVRYLEHFYRHESIRVVGLQVPAEYQTPNGTGLKARGLHYAVEARRRGWNFVAGRVFIVHFDEESVMLPNELRKLLYVLAKTDKKILEGPIYYPLEYQHTSSVCKSMEANRPAGCFECRVVMEKGVPLHLHGSNLVVEEQLENEIGWDIGQLEQNYFIAEDFVFGMNNYLRYGKEIFGWHGCVLLEQPPFSFKSAFRQRHRWVFGVLQGLAAAEASPEFKSLPGRTRKNFLWGTRFRVFTFAAGAVVGLLSVIILPLMLAISTYYVATGEPAPFGAALTLWMTVVGGLWLGTVMMGAWLNVRDAHMSGLRRELEIARAIAVAPLAGILESSAGFKAIVDWSKGKRGVAWIPTPKTLAADAQAIKKSDQEASRGSSEEPTKIDSKVLDSADSQIVMEKAFEALMLPGEELGPLRTNYLATVLLFTVASLVGTTYIIAPLLMFLLPFIESPVNALVIAIAVFYLGIAAVRVVLRAILTSSRGEMRSGIRSVRHRHLRPARQQKMLALMAATSAVCLTLILIMVLTSPPVESFRYGTAQELVRNGGDGDKVLFGAQIDWEKTSPDSYTEVFGRSAYVYGKFLDFPLTEERRRSIDSAAVQVAGHKGILFVTLQPYDGLDTVTAESMEQLAIDLTRWNEMGAPVMVRFAHEMNGSWYPWSQQPTEYIRAFRDVAAAVHSAPDSVIVWSPNDGTGYPFIGSEYVAKPGSAAFSLLDTNHDNLLSEADDPYAPYYPGDDVVDWVGLSLYHFGAVYPWGANTIPEPTKFADMLTGNFRNKYRDARDVPDFYGTYAQGHGKPMSISETSAAFNPESSDGASSFDIKRAWWTQVFSEDNHRRFPRIKLVNWFEQEKVEADFGAAPIPWNILKDFDTRVNFRHDLPDWLLFPPPREPEFSGITPRL
ncbi:MAG: glycosyltransferase family 2 protein [Mycobacteriaceae bacterium]